MNEPASIGEYLEKNGTLTYANVGVSMLPLLRQGRDLFTVRKKGAERCRAGDVVLYRREGAPYVLHRIVRVRERDYVILGDNCVSYEIVPEEDVLGVMTGFVRDGREHSVDEPLYRAYDALWRHAAPLRIFLKRSAHRLRQRIR